MLKKRIKKLLISIQCLTGVDLRNVYRSFTFIPPKKYREFKRDMKELKNQLKKSEVSFPISCLYPIYPDKNSSAGEAQGHYFWQDSYVARRIFENNPQRHLDIGSSISGFVAHVSCFREIEVFDIRPLDKKIPNVIFRQCDLMNRENLQEGITDSISSLHALEHFGLGRYGDPVCYNGYLKGFNNISYLLKPNGKFYFSVPLGEQRIEFNAHRIFSLSYLIEMVSTDFTVDHFSYVDDKGDFFPEVEITQDIINDNCGCHYGCAIFVLTKKIRTL